MMRVNRTVAQNFELIMIFYDYEKKIEQIIENPALLLFCFRSRGQIDSFIMLLVS